MDGYAVLDIDRLETVLKRRLFWGWGCL